MTETETKYKTPKFQTKIHLPALPGSFTFKKNGKLRLDQQVKKFCLLNNCRGCFEVKVHFGFHINPNKINYDVNQNGISIDTLDQQQKYKLFVPLPKGLELIIPKDPEAQFFCGVLSAKLAIIKYDKSQVISTKKDDKKTKISATKTKTDDSVSETVENETETKKRPNKKRNKKRRLEALNKRISQNNSPPKKKRKLSKTPTKKKQKVKQTQSNEMNIDDAHKLIDGVVDKIDADVKQKRQLAQQKDDDIKEYLHKRAERKKNKALRKQEIREKFLERRNAKKKNQQDVQRKSSGKKVRFNL